MPNGSIEKCRHFKEREVPTAQQSQAEPHNFGEASNSEASTLRRPGPSVGKARMIATGPLPQETYTYARLNMLSGEEVPHGLTKLRGTLSLLNTVTVVYVVYAVLKPTQVC